MGLTLIAILIAALLLPGLLAVRAFYHGAETGEVEVPVPALSTAEGIALVGGFSVAVHLAYVLALQLILLLPPLIPLPLANPYALFTAQPEVGSLAAAYSLFAGLSGLGVLAYGIGFASGLLMALGDKSLFYGPLTEVFQKGEGDDRFIAAYVVSKIAHEKSLLGYQGAVVSLQYDENRYPAKVVLKDVVPFYLNLSADGPQREESKQPIHWLVLSADEWHNIAFKVFRVEGEAANVARTNWPRRNALLEPGIPLPFATAGLGLLAATIVPGGWDGGDGFLAGLGGGLAIIVAISMRRGFAAKSGRKASHGR
ncbi:MAG TPA: hypothetical protein VF782_14920 [Allosphingosinicella sp.]|jgi:hypothetical protein